MEINKKTVFFLLKILKSWLLSSLTLKTAFTLCGRSSGVEHNLAKVGVEGSNPFARSNYYLSFFI
jgi:hypothetical protein